MTEIYTNENNEGFIMGWQYFQINNGWCRISSKLLTTLTGG